ncbi:ribosomal protein L18e/L15-like protein [Leptospira kirschneri serovar Bim str. 1051]|nr:ribosomal protein L18e/L15-like protein [Leptospira kirschneri serovar Bim str. 1051]
MTGNIDAKIMVQSKILDKETTLFKILGTGEIKKAIHVIADGFSQSAKEKIEKAGGSIKLRAELKLAASETKK